MSQTKPLTPREIKAIRKKLRESRFGMADVLGVDRADYVRWETGKSAPDQVTEDMIRFLDKNGIR